MSRLASYLGIIIIFFIGLFVVALSSTAPVQPIPATAPQTASSTLSIVPSITVPSINLPDLESNPNLESKNTVATSSTRTASVPKKVIQSSTSTPGTPAQPAIAPLTLPQLPPPSSGDISLDVSASLLRSALVNIICYVPSGSGLHSISGSGVIIDPKGIILTNAHIAQYFLLADRGVSCTIRAGSPAINSYKAALIFIPPAWLRANANILTQTAPVGTGEYDFALLAIEKSTTAVPLPTLFPSLPLAITPPTIGTPVVIASYGAQFLETNQIQSSLFPTIVFGSVKDVFTFKTNTIDVLALGGSAAAQEGSSGGGVADASGKLVGTITTSTTQGATATRSLSAITASYIRAEYASEMGSALDILLAEPTPTAIADFAPKIPMLESILTAQLP